MAAAFVIDGANFNHIAKAGRKSLNVTGKRLYTTISKNLREPCLHHAVLFHVQNMYYYRDTIK